MLILTVLSVLSFFLIMTPPEAISSCSVPANAIEAENCKTGNPTSEWDINGAGDTTIQGFATDISVNKGETVHFKISTTAAAYRLDIYRIGYYGGMGARKVSTVTPSAQLPQAQTACVNDTTTKLTDCGNWAESASWAVPVDAVSGIYIAKLVRSDTGGSSHIIFIVRDDSGGSDLLFKTSDTTWQAYNSYGLGYIEYPDYGYPSQKATKASYNRPFLTRSVNNGLGAYNWFFQAEYPMVRWLEANGYNISYFTSVDADRFGSKILGHKTFLSVGHDEYWSGQGRTNVEAARTAGVNLAFFSGNEIYRKIRWENSIDGSGTPYRTMVCYNESNAPVTTDPADPPIWTGTWRNPTFSPPADGGRPENALSGTLFTVSEGPNALGISLSVPQANGKMRFWRNTAVASLAAGQTATLGNQVVGYEFDEDIDNGSRPAGLIQLSSTTTPTQGMLLGDNVNIGADVYLPGTATHVMTMYRASSKALVFSAGTVQWSWGLDAQHDNGPSVIDANIQQATVNVLADMGVQPVSLQSGLVAATASTDLTAPSSTITSPTSGATLNIGSAVTITGTAADSGGGIIGAVEVSTDNGTTWHPATGRESWSYAWIPAAAGSVTLRSRAVDDSGNMETPSSGVTVTVAPQQSNFNIWPGAVPSVIDSGPDSAVELGVKFRADSNGYINGIRFYKSSANTGTHVGNLWSSSGTRLATATFTNETASGWQVVTFPSPVAITANTVYVASYHTNTGHYSDDLLYFSTKGMDTPPLHALADGVSGANGVYAYGSTSSFPSNGWKSSNYWVDVVYNQTPPPTLSSISVTPLNQTILSGTTKQYTATGTYSDSTTQDITGQVTWASSNTGVATINSSGLASAVAAGSTTISAVLSGKTGGAALTVQAAPLTVTTSSLPAATLNAAYSTTLAASGGTMPYTWSITTGSLPSGLSLNSSTGVISGTPATTGSSSFTAQAADSSTPVQTATSSLSITVAAQTNYTIWPSGTVPTLIDAGADSSVELGVKFRSDAAGYVTGIRFYKASANTGTHVGNLWSSSGTRLATATFTNETASGWQQVNFSAPVAIAANTVYVASYLCPAGHYSDTINFFVSAGIDNAPLHALANGVSGVNGVYAYGSSSNYPSNGWNSSNYWVDVVFSSSVPADATPPTVTTFTVPANSTVLTVPINSFVATDNVGVTGYLVTESSTTPSASVAGWTSSAPTSYTFATTGSKTLYAWAKDAAGNVSAAKSAGVVISIDTTPPVVNAVVPSSGATGTGVGANLTAVFSETMDSSTINSGTFQLHDASNTLLSATVAYDGSTNTATLDPESSFQYSSTYTATIKGGASGVKDAAGNPLATDFTWSFNTGAAPPPGNIPILIISSTANPFSSYYAEILRTEGFNSFDVSDIAALTSTVLNSHDIAVLGDVALTSAQVTMLTNWVNAGGNLITMHPDKKLAGLLGLTDKGTTLSNAYLLVDTSSGAGLGIVNQTIQYHGSADRYTVNGASKLATLYSTASTSASDPAVTLNTVGTSGGQAAAFTYDLARSVVYTRQGNPAWAGQTRDGLAPTRSDDLFFGAASFDPQPDWVDLSKVAIPQADEQQRLLANLIIRMNYAKKPLPRFWYLPRGLAAAVIMTGDDHGAFVGGGATASRFNQFLADSPQGCVVDNWECVRGTAYLLPPSVADNPLTNSQAASYNSSGFEISVHVDSSPDCADWTPSALDSFYTSSLSSFALVYTSVPAPKTHRMHCVSWSDYASQPKTELSHGIRLDTTYYYYPPTWANDRPGMFTGSGMPMRFTDANGNLIDVYQAATQMTDESGQSYPYTVNALLDGAIGASGYYGVFTVNAHNDTATSAVSDAVVNSALTRGIPVVTASQMLTWLDGRNGSSFNSMVWNGSTLGFSVSAAQGANGLMAMSPVPAGQLVTGITKDGSSIPFTISMVKGVSYARFAAATGSYLVSYAPDVTPPVVTSVTPAAASTDVQISINPGAVFSKDMDTSTITASTFVLRDPSNVLVPATVTYNGATRTATLAPTAALANSKTYTATIKGGASGAKDLVGNLLASDYNWSFTTVAAATGPYTIWPSSTVPGTVDSGPDSAVELGVKFRSDISGTITGIRFYKASANTGTHVGNLWSSSGTLLATAVFTNETASGWQQVTFSNPVAITANTVYVASYHTNGGHYSDDINYFAGKGMDSVPLHALADGVSGANGVYVYGSGSNFPSNGWKGSNYWVDVVFQP
jgi:hypothetical protein